MEMTGMGWFADWRLCGEDIQKRPISYYGLSDQMLVPDSGALEKAVGALSVLLKILAVAVLLPLAFCVALPQGINDFRAANWTSSYSQLPHPDGTERVLLHSGIEKISNGDNCDFVVLEARSYAAEDQAAIRTFYSSHWARTEPYSAQFRPDFIVSGADVYDFEPYRKFQIDVQRIYAGPYYILVGDINFKNDPPLLDWRCV
jgi:hypothetical protein